MSNKLEQLESKLEKILGFRNMQEELEKVLEWKFLERMKIHLEKPFIAF